MHCALKELYAYPQPQALLQFYNVDTTLINHMN